jgi:hypothetical protein
MKFLILHTFAGCERRKGTYIARESDCSGGENDPDLLLGVINGTLETQGTRVRFKVGW